MTGGQEWRKDADKVPQETLRRMAARGIKMAFRQTSGNNKATTGATLGVSNPAQQQGREERLLPPSLLVFTASVQLLF